MADLAERIRVWTDGACWPNPGPGGWAFIGLQPCGDCVERSGVDTDTTNNRMEIMAVLEALREMPDAAAPVVYTDSQYVQKGVTEWMASWKLNGWRRRERKRMVAVKNADLWQALDAEVRRTAADVVWVRGHAGNAMNERADKLAEKAAEVARSAAALESGIAEWVESGPVIGENVGEEDFWFMPESDAPMRVMVTGSRDWTDASIIRMALAPFVGDARTLVHGAARGADLMAAAIAEGLGFTLDPFPAEWRTGGVYNARAGKERNIEMLDSGVAHVLAFHLNNSSGTAHAVAEAIRRGIPVTRYVVEGDYSAVTIERYGGDTK